MQIVGLSGGAANRIVKNDPENNRISIFHFIGSKLIAIDTVNNPAAHMIGRKLLAKGVSPRPEDLERPEYNLREML